MLAGDQDLAEKGRYAREICQTIRVPLHHTASKTNPAESDAKHEPSPPTTTSLLYLMRPPAEAKQKSLLICLPRRMATKAVLDALNQAYGWPCGNKTTATTSPPQNSSRCVSGDFESMRNVTAALTGNEDVLKVVFTRHPFDRIILGYRHSKNTTTTTSAVAAEFFRGRGAGRSLLYAHPRILGASKKRTGKINQFLEYVKTQVRPEVF